MHQLLLHKLLGTVNKMVGITLQMQGKESVIYHAVLLEKKKGEISISKRLQDIDSDDALKAFIPAGWPVCINIEGWGVLIKKVEFDLEGNILGQVVPNIDDFEVYPYRHEDSKKGFVAIIRNAVLHSEIEHLQALNIEIVSINAGPFAVAPILQSLGLEGEQLVGNWKLDLNQGQLTSIKALGTTEHINYQLSGDTLSSLFLPGFSIAANYLAGQFETDIYSSAFNEEYSYKKLGTFSLYAVLGILFGALLVNFLLFDTYNKDYNRISREYNLNESVLKQLTLAEQEIKLKQDLILKGGLDGTSQFSYYIDRLISLMPKKLTLLKIEVHPSLKKIQKGKEIEFAMHTISIEGETKETLEVHRWIESMKKEEWLKDVEMVYYGREETSKAAVFNLELKY